MDLAGPMKTQSIQSNLYHFIIVDNFMCYKWVLFLPRKINAFKAFIKFHALVSTYYKGTLRAAQSDHGGEFLSKEFIQHMEKQGVHHQLMVLHMPQQMVSQKGQTGPWLKLLEQCCKVQACHRGFGNVQSPQLYTYETVHHHV